MKTALGFLLSTTLLAVVFAHDQAHQKIISGSPDYAERVARTKAHEPEKMSAALQNKSVRKLRREEMLARGMSPAQVAEQLYGGGPSLAYPYHARPELKSKGTVKTLTILIDFKDFRASDTFPHLTVGAIQQNIYGQGTAFAKTQAPYDSVNAYYARASQTQVNIQGNVLGWHQFPNDRNSYRPNLVGLSQNEKFARENAAIFAMLKQALTSIAPTHDFSQYDNDNDGDIDLVTILYAGPPTGWGSFWWAYRWAFYTPEATNVTFGGKRANQFVFQFVSERGNGADFDPSTLMHEMGHAFGLPDYYDYDDGVGPPGGVGKLDMMDANWANHNAFSRWLLDWIKPEIISSGAPVERILNASGAPTTDNKAIAIFPRLADSDAPAQELFMIENRSRVGNDGGIANLPGEGLLIWHVVATPNTSDDGFVLDNSFTDTKLIRLLRCGTRNDFGNGEDQADANTLFGKGKNFTPTSIPDSSNYAGQHTGISVTEISDSGLTMTAKVGFVATVPRPGRPLNVPFLQPASPPSNAPPEKSTENLDLSAIEEAAAVAADAKPEDLRKAWDAVASPAKLAQLTRQEQIVLGMQLQQWASKDGPAAVTTLLNSESQSFVQQVLPSVLDAWSASNPSAAHAWLQSSAIKTLLAQRAIKPDGQFVRSVYAWHAKNDFNAALANALKPENADMLIDAIQGLEGAADIAGIDRDTIYLNAAKANLSPEIISAMQKLLMDRAEAALRVDPNAATKALMSHEKFRLDANSL